METHYTNRFEERRERKEGRRRQRGVEGQQMKQSELFCFTLYQQKHVRTH